MRETNLQTTTWRKVKLGEVSALITKGTTPTTIGGDFVSKGINFIKAESITDDGRFIKEKFGHIDEKTNQLLKRSVILENDILYSIAGVIGRSALVTKEVVPANINQALAIIRLDKNQADPKYIFYVLSTTKQRNLSNSFVAQSVQANINLKQVGDFGISLPEITVQKRIADILSAFDDKIELNNKISKNLEQTAQAIFKEWFGKSEKLKAKSEKLFKLGKIICGKTPSKSNLKYFGGEIPFIKIPDMHNQMFILKTEDSLTEVGADSQKNKFIPRNSICVSCIATVGLVSITTKDSQTNQQINTIIPKSESYLEFLYLALKTIKNDLMLIGSGGSTTLNINTSIFSNIEILVPEEEVIDKFHKLANPMFNKILQINKENQELATLRDLLLPKLMRGEIV